MALVCHLCLVGPGQRKLLCLFRTVLFQLFPARLSRLFSSLLRPIQSQCDQIMVSISCYNLLVALPVAFGNYGSTLLSNFFVKSSACSSPYLEYGSSQCSDFP